jgi:hypothetical protein
MPAIIDSGMGRRRLDYGCPWAISVSAMCPAAAVTAGDSILVKRHPTTAAARTQIINRRAIRRGGVSGVRICDADFHLGLGNILIEYLSQTLYVGHRHYAKIDRMRILSSTKVVETAERIARKILDTYLEPDKSFIELREMVNSGSVNPIREFSEACRVEFEMVRIA